MRPSKNFSCAGNSYAQKRNSNIAVPAWYLVLSHSSLGWSEGTCAVLSLTRLPFYQKTFALLRCAQFSHQGFAPTKVTTKTAAFGFPINGTHSMDHPLCRQCSTNRGLSLRCSQRELGEAHFKYVFLCKYDSPLTSQIKHNLQLIPHTQKKHASYPPIRFNHHPASKFSRIWLVFLISFSDPKLPNLLNPPQPQAPHLPGSGIPTCED